MEVDRMIECYKVKRLRVELNENEITWLNWILDKVWEYNL